MTSVDVVIIGSNLPAYATARLLAPHLSTMVVKTLQIQNTRDSQLRPINHRDHSGLVTLHGKDCAAEVVNFGHRNLDHLLSLLGPRGTAKTVVESYDAMVEDYCEFVRNMSISSEVKRTTEILFGDEARKVTGKPGVVRFRSPVVSREALCDEFREQALESGLMEVGTVESMQNAHGSWRLETDEGSVFTEKLVFCSDHHAAEFWSVLQMDEAIEFHFSDEATMAVFNSGLLRKLSHSSLPIVARLSDTVYLNVNYSYKTTLSSLLSSFEIAKAVLFGSRIDVPKAYSLQDNSIAARL